MQNTFTPHKQESPLLRTQSVCNAFPSHHKPARGKYLTSQKLIWRCSIILLTSLLLILTTGCNEDEEFMFDINDLLETPWGIPQIIEPGEGPIDLDAPTVFNADGLVTIGPSRTDFWNIRGSRSIILQQSQQVWFIIDLSPERLYVEKSSHPQGQFLVKCLYEPMK